MRSKKGGREMCSLSDPQLNFLIAVAKSRSFPSGAEHSVARKLVDLKLIRARIRGRLYEAPFDLTKEGRVALASFVRRFDDALRISTDKGRTIIYALRHRDAYEHPHAFCGTATKPSSWSPNLDGEAEAEAVSRIARAIMDVRFATIPRAFDPTFPTRCDDLRAAIILEEK